MTVTICVAGVTTPLQVSLTGSDRSCTLEAGLLRLDAAGVVAREWSGELVRELSLDLPAPYGCCWDDDERKLLIDSADIVALWSRVHDCVRFGRGGSSTIVNCTAVGGTTRSKWMLVRSKTRTLPSCRDGDC